ncbi:MAG: HIRAN domain-containing protein [Adlercreutzia equolifaciens]
MRKATKGDRLSSCGRGQPHDGWAVEVRDGADRRIGYVSCECNEFVARLIDGGKSVEGRLTDKEQIGSWTRLVMEVVLND